MSIVFERLLLRARRSLETVISALVRAFPLICTMAALLVPSLATGQSAGERGPGVSLFPTAVRENIRFTQETAASMESALESIVSDLDAQMETYTRSKCQGATEDPGCQQIQANISSTFKSMLDQLAASMPDMERAVRQTNLTLGARLRDEIGRKMTARDVQQTLLDGYARQSTERPSAERRRSRMSQNFQRYYDLIRTQSGEQLSTLAALIYLDTEESLRYIELIQAEVERGIVTLELEQFLGELTPEMVGTVNGVKALLFGEPYADEETIPEPPTPLAELEFESPWELKP